MDAAQLISSLIRDLPGNIAVLDREGVIISVNASWLRFAARNGLQSFIGVGPGTNYLAVCRTAAQAGDKLAGQIKRGLLGVLDGSLPHYDCEYPCHGAEGIQRWFALRATPLAGGFAGAVVCHTNITVEFRARLRLAGLDDVPGGGETALPVATHPQAGREVADMPLVTMCSSCKRVRDAGLQWREIEEWLYAHHDQRFSHGMCAECIERLYPGALEDRL